MDFPVRHGMLEESKKPLPCVIVGRNLAIPLSQPPPALTEIDITQQSVGASRPARLHLFDELLASLEGLGSTCPASEEVGHVIVQPDGVGICGNILPLVLNLPEHALGKLKPVRLEATADQLARSAQHGMVSPVNAVTMQT